MTRHCEVAILGPSSSFKTRTGRDIKDGLDDACLLSIGSIFRVTAEKLGNYGVPSKAVSSPMVESILQQLDIKITDDVVTVQNGDGTVFAHTYENGTIAADYSVNSVVQDRVLNYVNYLTNELHTAYSTVIFEGRRSTKSGLNIFLTAPTHVRTEIKKIECDIGHLSDEEIANGIRRRDLQDAGKKIEPLKRPQAGYVIRRESVSDEEHEAIVQFGIDVIKNFRESRDPLPRHQIVYTYNSEMSALQERVPSYR